MDYSDQKIREILSSSPAILYACRADGDFGATFVSENITPILGYSPQECLENPDFWRGNIHPDDAPEVLEKFEQFFAKGHHVHEYRFRKKDGSYIWVFDEIRLIRDPDGNPLEMVGSWSDITARKTAEVSLKKSEELFRAFFQANPAATIITSPAGLVHMTNPAFVDLTGFSSEEIVGKTVQELGFWPELDARDQMITAIRKHGYVNYLENQFNGKNNRSMTCLVSCRAVEYGGEQALLSILIDITEQKKSEAAMRKLDEIKSDFISTAAHELRTPLTSIMGFSEMISDQKLAERLSEEQRTEMLHEIFENSVRLSTIIDDLLDVSRMEAGQDLPLDKKPQSINGLLEKVARRYELKAVHQVSLDFNSCNSSRLEFDTQRIEQVVENLLSNATKYSPEGSKITISAESVDDQCRISVVDQGDGMSEEQVSRVFDKFYRANPSDSSIVGFGLGMSIAKKIVEDHDGKIWVDSEPGKGTQVHFTLPETNSDSKDPR